MKNLYTLLLVISCAFVGKAQIINFPDPAFKAKLLSASPTNQIASFHVPVYDAANYTWSVSSYSGIDTNNDGEIQVSEALAIKYLDVSYTNADITGVESFQNLWILNCSQTSITTLNVNGLTNLRKLDCSTNYLTNLNISALTNLITLNCDNNQLPSLNLNGLINLRVLYCNVNHIPSLNLSGLIHLQILICDGNQLSSIDVSILISLQTLYCGFNQLSSLNLIGLDNLQELNCENNQLQSLNLSDLFNLTSVICNNNQITNINLSGLTNLNLLRCYYNQITSINLSGLINLGTLKCEFNQLTSLNLNDCISLFDLGCSNNNLTTLEIKNGINNYSDFSSNPNLHYICADESEISGVQSLIIQYGYINCEVNTYCSFTPGGTFYTIQGSNHFDIDNNGCNANDSLIPKIKLNFSNGTTSGSLIADTTGNYSIPVSAGTHTFTPVLENPSYFNVSPTTATVTFPTTASPFVQDFCVTANGVHQDVEVVLIPITRARPGFDAVYKLVYKNKGTTTQSGTISVTFNDAVLDLVSSNPAVATQTLNNLSWNFSNLVPFATSEILFSLNVNSPVETPAVHGGDILPFTASINTTATDETPNDNTFAYNQYVVNSFDPNEKECLEGSNIALAKVGDYVHYVIHFQNDGSANAENIVIRVC